MKRPIAIFIVFAAICLVLIPFWALQSKGGADASPGSTVPADNQQGLQVFQINCGACHTLAAAGTDGEIGPNLDQLLGTGQKSPDVVDGELRPRPGGDPGWHRRTDAEGARPGRPGQGRRPFRGQQRLLRPDFGNSHDVGLTVLVVVLHSLAGAQTEHPG